MRSLLDDIVWAPSRQWNPDTHSVTHSRQASALFLQCVFRCHHIIPQMSFRTILFGPDPVSDIVFRCTASSISNMELVFCLPLSFMTLTVLKSAGQSLHGRPLGADSEGFFMVNFRVNIFGRHGHILQDTRSCASHPWSCLHRFNCCLPGFSAVSLSCPPL